MAGTIEVAGGAEWSAATWLYEWALKIASEQIGNPALKQRLQDVIDSNVGWVNRSISRVDSSKMRAKVWSLTHLPMRA